MSDSHFNTYFIVDDVQAATSVIDILHEENIQDDDIGVVSKDSDIATADLPQVDLTDKSKLPEALKRGALLGSGSGLLAGVLLSVFPVAGITLGGAAILGMTAGGAAMGAWSASMIGISEDSPLVEEFDDALKAKKTLIFCQLSDEQKQHLKAKVKDSSATGKVKQGNTTN